MKRRTFLKQSAVAMAGAAAGPARRAHAAATQPNFLFVICDQLNLDAIAAQGTPYAHTPNLDRLVARGTTFLESHSTNPVCSPARSSLVTGRMPVETGVITNDRPIHESVPNMGQWFGRAGYDTVHCGKWHLPEGYPIRMPGFRVLPLGGGQGDLEDHHLARTCEAYLRNRSRDKPFLLVAAFMQPHDICYWAIKGPALVPETLPFPELAGKLPALPPNHQAFPEAPQRLAATAFRGFTEEQWRYYLYVYYRQVEMLDADVGRLLNALEDSGEAENTIIVFTSDHGEGAGRHSHVQKWYPYDEAMKVPLVFSCPGRIAESVRDDTHLVAGLDLMPTFCDYAGIETPGGAWARNLRPLLEGGNEPWREFLVSEVQVVGRMLRTGRFKYVHYEGDPVEQLFDMKADPWETRNLYQEARYADELAAHRRLLDEWNSRLDIVEPTPSAV